MRKVEMTEVEGTKGASELGVGSLKVGRRSYRFLVVS
jgi:hypothetical protein